MNTEQKQIRKIRNLEWRDNYKELSKTFRNFAKDHNMSDNDIRRVLFSLACEYKPEESKYVEDKVKSELYKASEENFKEHSKDYFNELWDLFIKIEGDVVSFLIDHPDMIKAIQDEAKQSSEEMKNVCPSFIQPIDFCVQFDDVLETLKGRNFNGDMYIGFSAGRKNINLM